MVRQITENSYTEIYEYHGCNMIERTRANFFRATVLREWMVFDSVEEAEAFFNEQGWTSETAQ